jgi:serine/threonine protein kinase
VTDVFLLIILRSIDWWALGIVCFELMTGWPPFFDKDFEQMSQKILMKPLRFPSKYGIRPEAQVMIRSLLERDPNARLPCCLPAVQNGSNH